MSITDIVALSCESAKKLLFMSIFAVIFFCAAPAWSQDQSGAVLQELEEGDTVPPEKLPDEPVIEEGKLPEMEYDAGRKIFLREIHIKGVTLIDMNTVNEIVKSVLPPRPEGMTEGRELSMGDIASVCATITREYRARGYVTSYAYIPEQDVTDGILDLGVVEARFGDVYVSGNEHFGTPYIERHFAGVKASPALNRRSLERALLILNDNPWLAVKSSIMPGRDPSTSDLAILARDRFPVSASLTFDNHGTKTTSRYRAGLSLSLGNLIADGDILSLSGLTGLDRIDFNRLSYWRASYDIPVAGCGTTAGVHYSNSIYEAGDVFTQLDINGKAHVVGISVSHPLIRQRNITLRLNAGLEYKDVYDYMLGSLRSRDNIREFTVGFDYDSIDRFMGRNVMGFKYYQGLGGVFGGNGKNDPGTSRMKADGQFTKFTADIARLQRLTGFATLILRVSGQYSDAPLFVAEQFFIGGPNSVRGFMPSTFGGDSGYLLSIEADVSPILPDSRILGRRVGDLFNVALFADHGGVFREDVQPGEAEDDYLTSIGLGARIKIDDLFSFKVDWAMPRINDKFEADESETWFKATVSY